MKAFLKGFWYLLKEIGDQNAYARHLAAHRVADTPVEWRKFSDERFRQKYSKAKCC